MPVAGELYRQLVDLFHFYQYFPIDDHTGQPVTDAEMVALQYNRLTQLQRLFFKYPPLAQGAGTVQLWHTAEALSPGSLPSKGWTLQSSRILS